MSVATPAPILIQNDTLIIADIAHKDGTLKASKRGSLKTVLQSVPEIAQQIINEIKNNPNATLSEIAERIGVSRRWIASNMKHLQDIGVVKRVGPNKVGHWEIIGIEFKMLLGQKIKELRGSSDI